MNSSLKEVIEDALKYLDEKERLKTYKTWVFTEKHACNVNKMAEAGFIFIGNENKPDAVMCFFCKKNLDGWESTDNPWNEHIKHAPYCSFAKLQKPEDQITLRTYISIRSELLQKIKRSYFDEIFLNLAKVIKNMESRLKKGVN